MTDWYDMTKDQIVCDDCGKLQMRGLAFRDDFEEPVRLCKVCVKKHDQNDSVMRDRDHNHAMSVTSDDF